MIRTSAVSTLALAILALAILAMVPAIQVSARSLASDREAIHVVISAQLAAFRANDAELAYNLTTPAMQRNFADPGVFVETMRLVYPAVYRARAFHFDALKIRGNSATQSVVLLGEGEYALVAVYTLERQSDGRWLISACDLYASESPVI